MSSEKPHDAALTAGTPIPFYRPSVGDAEIAAVVEAMRSGWLTMGPKTREFEQVFAEWAGAPHAVAVNSATAGLHLGLDALGIGEGDEVLVPDITFTSTAATVFHCGAVPRLVDVDPDTLNMSVADAERKCGPRTRMIVPVHFAGHPCPMDEIGALAEDRGLHVMEDAAHALPASFAGRRIGSISPLTVFSFYATKNLTTGEGGMITTANAEVAEVLRSRRLHGMNRDAWKRYTAEGSWRYDVAYPGYKYNMTDIAASIGLVQMERLAELQQRREGLVARYLEGLADVEELELPSTRPGVGHAWHLFVLRLRLERLKIDRDEFIRRLNAAGIGTSVHFIPLHEHSFYRDRLGVGPEDLPIASREFPRMLSLPLFPDLSADEHERVIETVRRVVRENRR